MGASTQPMGHKSPPNRGVRVKMTLRMQEMWTSIIFIGENTPPPPRSHPPVKNPAYSPAVTHVWLSSPNVTGEEVNWCYVTLGYRVKCYG